MSWLSLRTCSSRNYHWIQRLMAITLGVANATYLFTPKRVKVRHQNPAPHGVFEEMLEMRGPVSAEDLALLRRMGAIK